MEFHKSKNGLLQNTWKSVPVWVLSATLLFSRCEDVLELEPAQSYTNDLALSSDASVKQVLTGAYDYLASSALYGGEIMRNSELYAGEGEIVWLGTYVGPREIFMRDILVTNYDVEDMWDQAYGTINTCNNILSALDVVNEEDRSRVEGEAKFIRGTVLFELTRFFGQPYEAGSGNPQPGVPIILSPSLSTTDNAAVSRSTVEECYNQVIADLTEAENLLPENNGVFATKWAAAAMLSRVYLQQGDFEGARDAADRVISSGDFQLMANYADAFMQEENTDEDVFAIQISAQDGSNAMNQFFATAAYGGRGDIQIEQSFYDLFDPADSRRTLYYKVAGKWRCGKFNSEVANLSVVRLAEMYLIRAECNSRLGTSTGASPVEDYNLVHTRAALPGAASVTLDDILFERRLELAQEGSKLHDVKRLKGNVAGMPYNDPKMVYPIPQREIQVNPNLEQNPGY